jgi:hypothetical protein
MVHKGVRVQCPKCLQQFRDKAELKLHVESLHEHVKYPCPDESCVKIFSSKKTLKRHLAIHRGEWKFTCNDCHKGFSSKSALESRTTSAMAVKKRTARKGPQKPIHWCAARKPKTKRVKSAVSCLKRKNH